MAHNLLTKARSLFRAVTGGRDESLIPERLAICKACEHHVIKPIINQTTLNREDKLFCNECGCGTYGIAELHYKLGYKALTCPKDKWGEAGALKPNEASQRITMSAMDRWKRENPQQAADMERKQQETIARLKAEQAARQQANGTANGVSTPSHPFAVPGLHDRMPAGPTAIPEHVFRQHFGPHTGRVETWPQPIGPMAPAPTPGAPPATGTTESPPPPTSPSSAADPTPASTAPQ